MDTTRHPSPERIDRYLRGMLKESGRDAVERHFMVCDACYQKVRERLGAELVGAGPVPVQDRPPRRSD